MTYRDSITQVFHFFNKFIVDTSLKIIENHIQNKNLRECSYMKKLKQITALIGVIVLVALYISTLVIAIRGGENSGRLLAASIYATVVLPVLLWAYTFIYKLIQQHVDLDKKKEAIAKAEAERKAAEETNEEA